MSTKKSTNETKEVKETVIQFPKKEKIANKEEKKKLVIIKKDVNKTDLSCLSERQRQVVLLVHGEGLSFAETGRRLGITRSNAYSTMRDVYKKLEKNS